MLVYEHAKRDAIGVEAVEEVLDVAADEEVKAKLLLVLDDSLSHGGNHVIVTVTDLNQQVQETESKSVKNVKGEKIHPPTSTDDQVI